MNPTEKYIEEICNFLMIDQRDFTFALSKLRDKSWQRWGGGTVEVTVAEILYVLTYLKEPHIVFEGGTNWGYSTAHIAEALKDTGRDPKDHFYTVDIDQVAINNACSFLWEKDIHIPLYRKDSVGWLNDAAVQDFKLDLLFIDTAHTYEYTRKEWKAMQPLLTENSIILFHDAVAVQYGINKFLSEIKTEGWSVLILDTKVETGLGIVKKEV
jgi:predicted O-methyltransferase YrrM